MSERFSRIKMEWLQEKTRSKLIVASDLLSGGELRIL
jgi:hypothetical protein